MISSAIRERNDLNSKELTVVKPGRKAGKHLLFVRCASDIPLCLRDYVPTEDLVVVLSFYRPAAFSIKDEFWVVEGGLSKFHAAKIFFELEPDFKNFELFAFFDNDIDISFGDLLQLFKLANEGNADLCQAAVAANSNTYWTLLKQKSPLLTWRETSFVEVMAPIFSRKAIYRCLDTFDLSISTWGLEYAWFHCCRNLKMGVIDKITMRHDASVDVVNGPFYRYLESIGVNAVEDGTRLKHRFVGRFYMECDIPPYVPRVVKLYYIGWRSLLSSLKARWRSGVYR